MLSATLPTMGVTVRIPTILRNYTGGAATVTGPAGTVREVIDALELSYPGIGLRVLDETGSLRRFVNVYVDQDDVRFVQGLGTAVGDGSTVSIIPAVAGG